VDLLRFEAGMPTFASPAAADVVICSGGKLALDAVRRCRDLGARNVTILFRETPDQSPLSDADVAACEGDGAVVRFSATVHRLFGSGSQLTGVEVLDLTSGQTERLSAQRLILPAGRFPEMIFIPTRETGSADAASSPMPPDWEGVLPYKQPWYRDQMGIFAEGDALTDYSAAIKAIGAGRRAAASLHLVMNGASLQLDEKVIGPQSYIQNIRSVENIKRFPRQIMPICREPDRTRCGEVELGFAEDTARKEAGRCLQCGLICYRTAPSKIPVHAAPSA
jgi:NADPH-dependent glutamate synthase beta subunit-like oxidoreductase